MAILALDLGLKTGWAVWCDDGSVGSGTQIMKRKYSDDYGVRFLLFHSWLTEMKNKYDITEIYYENVVRHTGTQAAHAYGGFKAMMSAWCEHHGIKYVGNGVAVGTIKKHVSGKGNANKNLMIVSVEKLGYKPCDDNEADALALLDYVVRKVKKWKTMRWF